MSGAWWAPATSQAFVPCYYPGRRITSVGVAAEIKQKINLVDLIGETVQLRKAGASFKGLCPFHGEKTPSFTVTPARETWKCFGCGRGGDLFNFVMERDSIDFPEALRRLAGRAGVEISEKTTREDARRKRLRDALDAAIAFYHRVLTESRHGQPALDYMRSRGFTRRDARAPTRSASRVDAWDDAEPGTHRAARLHRGGARGGRAGLAPVGQARRLRPFPRPDHLPHPRRIGQRHRARRPDRWIGAGARETTRDAGPKYLNSPATLLFDKSRTLYLIDRAKAAIRKEGLAVLVEGNTDALMAHQQGFDNVVGTLGTALTAGPGRARRRATRRASRWRMTSMPPGRARPRSAPRSCPRSSGRSSAAPHRGRLTDVEHRAPARRTRPRRGHARRPGRLARGDRPSRSRSWSS